MNNMNNPFNENFWGQFTQYFQKGLTSINSYRSQDSMLYVFSLPGIEDMTSVRIQLNGLTLRISGTIALSFPDYTLCEEGIFQGSFQRDIELPFATNEEHITAKYRNGLLMVTVRPFKAANEEEPSIVIEREEE
ncbi:MAG: Hsp20/alpha crystallin family protein [Bacilli bacterium]